QEISRPSSSSVESAKLNPPEQVHARLQSLPSWLERPSPRYECMRQAACRRSGGSARCFFEAQPNSSVGANFSFNARIPTQARTPLPGSRVKLGRIRVRVKQVSEVTIELFPGLLRLTVTE